MIVKMVVPDGDVMNRSLDVEGVRGVSVAELFKEQFIERTSNESCQKEQLFASMLDMVVRQIRQGDIDQPKGETDCCRRRMDQCDS